MPSPRIDDSQLRAFVRQKLLAGALRETVGHGAVCGVSLGSECAVCGVAIRPGKTEIQTFGATGSHRRYHPKCHRLLTVELEDLTQR
ncbi:MAG TPA: hypothetical protein VFB36_12245 [Nevskiaceae bacterium]|nr:hypothetical protein [Nevskiaceae bacterium]